MPESVTLPKKIIDFIAFDIWRIRLDDLPRNKSFLINKLRIVILTIKKFDQDHCSLRASALTFYTLLSIVPVVAMAFGVAKGFGYEVVLQNQLMERFKGQEEVFTMIINFANTLLENTRGGMMAGIGIIVLLWSVIKVLYHIEFSFNEIWEVKKARSFKRKLSNYISIMVIGPALLIASGSMMVFINTEVVMITEKIAFIGLMSPFIFMLLKILPYVMIWAILTFLYIIMPNKKVSFRSALIAAVIAGTTYIFVQWAYVHFQIGIAKFNAIYGSFAALPLFLIWLEISWFIVLFGAEISYAHQNVDKYEFEHDCQRISSYYKRLLSLQIAHLLIKNFAHGDGQLNASDISAKLGIPYALVEEVLIELTESKIILDIKLEDTEEFVYQPAKDINELSVSHVIEALDERGANRLPINETREFKEISRALSSFRTTLEESPHNKLLKDI